MLITIAQERGKSRHDELTHNTCCLTAFFEHKIFGEMENLLNGVFPDITVRHPAFGIRNLNIPDLLIRRGYYTSAMGARKKSSKFGVQGSA
jgi:hypothetical protein